MSDTELLIQLGRVLEAHAARTPGADFDTNDPTSNLYLFKKAGLLGLDECDVTLSVLDRVLRTLAAKLRAGEIVAIPIELPEVEEALIRP